MSGEAIELAAAYVSILPSTKGLGKGITRSMGDAGTQGGQAAGKGFRTRFGRGAKAAAKDTESTFTKTAKRLAVIAGGAFLAKKGWDVLKGTANTYKTVVGEAIKLRRYTGGTLADASRWRFVAQQSGIETDKMARAMGLFNKNLAAGKLDGFADSLKSEGKRVEHLGKAQDKLTKARQRLADLEAIQGAKKKLGVSDEIARRNALAAVSDAQADVNRLSVKGKAAINTLGFATRDANGKLLPMKTILRNVAERFKTMPDGPAKTALAMKVFGRSGADLLPLLNRGAKGVDELMKKADELGVTLTEKDAKALKEANKNSRLWKASWESMQLQIGRYVLPVMTRFVGFLASKMPPVIRWVSIHARKMSVAFQPFIDKIGPGMRRVAKFLEPIVARVRDFFKKDPSARFALLATIVGGVLVSSVIALGVALASAFSPIYLVVAALAALAFGVIYAYKKFPAFRNAVDKVKTWLVTKAWPAIKKFGEYLAQQWSHLVAYARRIWPQVHDSIRNVVGMIEALWRRFGGVLIDEAKVIFTFLKSTVSAGMEVIRGIIEVVTGILTLKWGKVWHGLTLIVGGVLKNIGALLILAFKSIINAFKGLGKALGPIFSAVWRGFKHAFVAVLNWIIRKWNNLGFKVPDIWGIPHRGETIHPPQIPLIDEGNGGGGKAKSNLAAQATVAPGRNPGAGPVKPRRSSRDRSAGNTFIFNNVEPSSMANHIAWGRAS